MAKVLNISNDGGTTWVPLPGSGAEFGVDAEGIDDTILGQTFQSQEVGLITWSMNSDGIFKGFAGYLAEVKKAGTPVTVTGESMTQESGQIYAIDDATREIWDRSATITVLDGASDETAEVEWFDYLFGRIKFLDTYTVLGSITIDVDYIPVAAAGKANTYDLTMSAEQVDESDFISTQANGGYRTFRPGLRSVSLELGGIFDATEAFAADVAARAEVIIEIDPVGDGSSIARGFFKALAAGQSGDVGALEEESVTFELTVPDDSQNQTVFNWRHTATTLSLSIQWLLTSWLTELNTYDAQYLPQGATGQSPLDGKEGNFMVADISLSGGLSNMNVFNAELIGTGVYTVV